MHQLLGLSIKRLDRLLGIRAIGFRLTEDCEQLLCGVLRDCAALGSLGLVVVGTRQAHIKQHGL